MRDRARRPGLDATRSQRITRRRCFHRRDRQDEVRAADGEIFSWVDKRDGFAGGKVHAKVAVADEAFCFISSANLTGHAMEKNMEAGVLIKGGATPLVCIGICEASYRRTSS